MTQSQYHIGGVKGLRDYLDVLGIIYKERVNSPKVKYYHKQNAVSFSTETEIDVSSLIAELEEKGLVLRAVRTL
jgi:hypothetical protein